MKNNVLLALFLLPTAAGLQAQAVSINTDASSPHPSAILDVKSTDKGMLVPRMTTAQRSAVAAPATGLLVFDTDSGSFWFYNGTAWTNLAAGGAPATYIADTDGNTRVQTEKNPNENIIRFDLDGAEKMLLRQNGHGAARLELPDVAGSTHIGTGAGQKNVPIASFSGYDNTFLGNLAGTTNTDGHSNTFLGGKAGLDNISGSNNTAVGAAALSNNTSRSGLVAVGDSALFNNGVGATLLSQAIGNTAVGSRALFSNSIGYDNTASGTYVLYSNTYGRGNTAIGSQALYSNSIGSDNIAHGANALYTNTSGNYNVAIGSNALYKNTIRSGLVAVGYQALFNNGLDATTFDHATNNTAVGYRALYSNTTGYNNTANGKEALYSNSTGYANTANGFGALKGNTTGFFNTATGIGALSSNTTGTYNTATGSTALFYNTTGYYNTAIGEAALYKNSTGYRNTTTGNAAMHENTTGNDNTVSGFVAMYDNTTGHSNTAIGSLALNHNNANNLSTAVGYGALYYADDRATGWDTYNTAVGAEALFGSPAASNNSGRYNTALGGLAMYFNSSGFNNTASGVSALYNNTTGNYNTAQGKNALTANTGGDFNTAIGYSAGSANDLNNNCTFLGYDADQSVTTDFSNSTALGNTARITASNQVRIGNSAVSSIGGYAPWTDLSDRRFKQNLRDDVPGLAFIARLQPVTYNLDIDALATQLGEDRPEAEEKENAYAPQGPDERTRQSRAAKSRIRYTGFVAQDVEEAARAIGYDFSGVDKPESEAGLYGLRYAQFVVPLVKAVQEQQAEMETLRAENAALKDQLRQITTALERAGIAVGAE